MTMENGLQASSIPQKIQPIYIILKKHSILLNNQSITLLLEKSPFMTVF